MDIAAGVEGAGAAGQSLAAVDPDGAGAADADATRIAEHEGAVVAALGLKQQVEDAGVLTCGEGEAFASAVRPRHRECDGAIRIRVRHAGLRCRGTHGLYRET